MTTTQPGLEPRAFGVPAYFCRLGSTPTTGDMTAEPVTMYGVAHMYGYPEDRDLERRVWRERRAFMARCFSAVCPEGEYGFVPVAAVEEITAEEFGWARDAGWPPAAG